MNRDGETSIWVLIGLILGVFVIFFIAFSFFGVPKALADAIPWFNSSSTRADGLALIALNLEDSNLYYYSGSDWDEITDSVVMLGSHEINRDSVRQTLLDFYRSPRKSSGKILTDTYKTWTPGIPLTSTLDQVVVSERFQPPFVGPSRTLWLYFRTTDEFDSLIYSSGELLSPGEESSLLERYNSAGYAEERAFVAAWRDEILKGRPYEKYVVINGVNYAVERRAQYLFIDLDEPALFGEDLYSQKSEEVEEEKMWANDATLEVRIDEPGSDIEALVWTKLDSQTPRWYARYTDSNGAEQYVLTTSTYAANNFGDFVMTQQQSLDFYQGLIVVGEGLDQEFDNYSGVSVWIVNNGSYRAHVPSNAEEEVESDEDHEAFLDYATIAYNQEFYEVTP